MADSPLSQADLERVAEAAAAYLERYPVASPEADRLRAALSAPEGERWGVEERPDWMPPVEQQPEGELYPSYPEHDQVDEAASRKAVEQQPDQVERGRALLKDGRLGAEFDVVPRSGSVGEDQRLTQALDKLTMVGVGYRARPMPVEDYELVEAAILILRALAGSVGEPDGGEGAEDEPEDRGFWKPEQI